VVLLVTVLFLVIGLSVLFFGAHFLVNGSSSLAKRLSISEMAIGLTVVAFGTSTPELMVNIFSSSSGHSDIVFGNIIGSNIFNILIILGISGVIYPLTVQSNTVWKEIPFSFLAVLLLFILANDRILLHSSQNELSSLDGLVFMGLFIVFLVYVFGISCIVSTDTLMVKVYSPLKTVLFIVIGFGCLFVGGKLVIDNSILLARQLSVSEKLIAITIVAGGTSLPELAASVVAAYKKKCDIAIGNIVGSNIFNIFFILGICSFMKGSPYNPAFNLDLLVLFAATLVLFVTMFTGSSRRLDRWEAIVFVVTYIIYLIFLFHRR